MPNRLAAETSPYLLQHADNAVDWWPWCEEAFERARSLDRPILLSIGYSACHWCHVMAHESFEDEGVAAAMNRDYVSIKVDREERPDVDLIYQTAHQVLTGRPGGWPLTMFLSPDATPFFGGTYFPKMPRYRLPGFLDLLGDIARTFAADRKEIEAHNRNLRNDLGKLSSLGTATHHSVFSAQPLELLRKRLQEGFDKRHGGFGEAPKFPRASDLEFLLHRSVTQGDQRARDMALITLTRMAEGGLFDHLGGGFFRYSTDERWQIPHFEKMLYDNGPLLRLYAGAWQIDGDARYRQVVEDTAAWAMREMQSPSGGYYAALDADSEGHEGRFYVWDRKEVKDALALALALALAPAAMTLVERHFGLDARPNFEGKAWHLCVAESLERSARKSGVSADEADRMLADARASLLAVRERRIRPGLDTKLLTGWNALMIAAMAHAARVFDRPDWLGSARRAFAFVRDSLWRDGRLLAASDGGPGRLNAYLDDHVFLIDAALELLQADFDAEDLLFAEELADALIENFEDAADGGFFFTRHDHEALIMRPKPLHDNATAAGNGVAARVLGRLGHLTGERRYLDAAERTLQACYGALSKSPLGCASLALGLAEALEPPTVIVIRGDGESLAAWQRELARHYLPNAICVAVPAGVRGLPPLLDKPSAGRTAAWVCRGTQCEAPVFELAALDKVIGNRVLRG